MHVTLVMEADEQGHRAFFLQALRDLDLVDSVTVVDESGGTFAEARETLGLKLRSTHHELASPAWLSAAPDLAIVSLIAAHAPPAVRRCLQAGCHVMVEKPACTHPDQFADLVDLAEERDRHLIVPLGPPPQSLGAGRPPHLRQRRAGPGLRAARRRDRRPNAHLARARRARLDLQALTGRRRSPGLAGHPLDRPDDLHHRITDRGSPGHDGRGGRRAHRRGGPGAGQPALRQRRLWLAGLRLPAGQALPAGPESLGLQRLASLRSVRPTPA